MDCLQCSGGSTSSRNTLTTPEPFYIPGYSGYVPQAQYRPGHTFGVTSHRVLIDPCVHMSPRSLLNNIHPENCGGQYGRPGIGSDSFTANQMALVNTRVNSFGRQQYQANMTSGYTGYVPRFQTILGHTYSPACNRALARFEQEQWRDRLFTKELEALDGWRLCYKTKPWESPEKYRMNSGDLQEFSYPSPPPAPVVEQSYQASSPASGSGCFRCSGKSSKAVSGCGDNSDASKSILSRDHPKCDYGERRRWGLAMEKADPKPSGCLPIRQTFRYPIPENRVQVIYKHCEGLTPNYMGHVPGAPYRIGRTFGRATRNAKKVLEPIQRKPYCYPLKH